MMAQSIKYLFTFISAAYFLLVGTGYNVVNYCCNACANEGIEAVATSSCNSVHHHSHSTNHFHTNGDMSCSDFNHHPAGCHLLRINTDIPSFQTTLDKSFNTINSFNLFYKVVNYSTEKFELTSQDIVHPPNGYLLSTGREIITFQAVLLI